MNNRSGFISIGIVIAVIVAIALGGGGYYLAKKGTFTQTARADFRVEREGNEMVLFKNNVETGLRVPIRLAGNAEVEVNIVVSPDGRNAMYNMWNTATLKSEIYVSNIDGTNAQKVAEQKAPEGQGGLSADSLVWADDGKSITYKEEAVVTMNADKPMQTIEYKVDLDLGGTVTNLPSPLLSGDRSCGKKTIYVSVSNEDIAKARTYFAANNLQIVREEVVRDGSLQFRLDVGIQGKDVIYVRQIEADGIGDASYDTDGCDWVETPVPTGGTVNSSLYMNGAQLKGERVGSLIVVTLNTTEKKNVATSNFNTYLRLASGGGANPNPSTKQCVEVSVGISNTQLVTCDDMGEKSAYAYRKGGAVDLYFEYDGKSAFDVDQIKATISAFKVN